MKNFMKIWFLVTFALFTANSQAVAYEMVIKNGTIVTAERTFKSDVAIEGEKIVKIAEDIAPGDARVIDATGRHILPGAIDAHVHFNLSFCGTNSLGWADGTKAAACGGVTTVIDYAIQAKGSSLKEAVDSRMADANGKVVIDYSLHGGITDWHEKTRDEMRYFTRNGIPSFKMFMIYKSAGWMADDEALYSALEETKQSGGLLMLHAESDTVLDLLTRRYHTPEMMEKYGAYCHTLARPAVTEFEAVQRAITWARETDGRLYFVHVSTARGAQMIQQANREGKSIWGETCPQYLLLTDDVFKRKDGHLFATCPQIKSRRDQVGLIASVRSGGLSVLATDDCTFNTEQKAMWNGDFTKIPFGMPGVETLLPTMYSELVGKNDMQFSQLVSLVSTNPARLFGLYPRKGAIQVGSDADIVIFDVNQTREISAKNLATKCDWSPFEGFKIKGIPSLTISRGKIVAENGKFTGSEGHGRFVPGEPDGQIKATSL